MVIIEMFRNADDDALRFAAEQRIFSEGEAGDAMYVVLEGQVDLLVKGKLVEEVGPGGVLGEMSLIDSAPRSATAVARTSSKLVRINEKRFKFLVQQTPYFALQLMRVIADRLSGASLCDPLYLFFPRYLPHGARNGKSRTGPRRSRQLGRLL